MVRLLVTALLMFSLVKLVAAEDTIELRTTTIKGNKELPKILYVVPWKDIKQTKKAERKLVLHSLFGDLFDPMVPHQELTFSQSKP